jgi:hypothetical protein
MALLSRAAAPAGRHRVALGAALLALAAACGGGGGGGGAVPGGSVGGADYTVTPSAPSLAFAAERNTISPPAQTLRVAFDGEGLVVGYPPGASAPGWLTASLTNATASSATLRVQVTSTALPVGTYRATLRLVTGKADGSAFTYADVAVEYTVRAGLRLSSTAPLAFEVVDGTAPAAQVVTLLSDVVPKDWRLVVEPVGTNRADWLTLSATSGTFAAADVVVQVAAVRRPPGTYTANLVLRDAAGAERGRISASYRVTPAFALAGTLAARVTHAATLTSLDLPLTLESKVDATAGAAHRWRATSTAAWAAVVPESGDLAQGSTLTVRLDPARLWGLANATHSATITVTSAEGGSTTASVPLALTLALAPALTAPATVAYAVGVAAAPADLTRDVAVGSNLGEAFAAYGGWSASTAAAWLRPGAAGAAGFALELVPAALGGLANGAHAASVTLTPVEARVASATVTANLLLALPDVAHVAPYATWPGRSADVVLRGSGFGTTGTLPVRVGSETVTATVVSDGELRLTVPAQAAPVRLPVKVVNSLGLARASSELVILPLPGYAAHTATLDGAPRRLTLDPERQAVLVSGATGEIRRFRFAAGAWAEDAFAAPAASGVAVTVDGRALLVTSGTTATSSQVFYEVDPVSFAIRKQTPYPSYYARFELPAPLNDGRTLILNAEQWTDTILYPELTRGPYIDAHNPSILLSGDRGRLLVYDDLPKLSSYDAADAAAKVRAVTQTFDPRGGWAMSADGSRVVLGNAVYDRDFAFVGFVGLQGDRGMPRVALSADGATVYTLARNSADTGWVFRRADLRTAPFTAGAPLALALPAEETPVAMTLSEDGGALFLLTHVYSLYAATRTTFRAVPLE